MTIRKQLAAWALLLSLTVLTAACSTHASTSLTFQVETGDQITVAVDLKAGYTQNTEVPFTISRDEKEISTGTFITLEDYQNYSQLVSGGSPKTTLIAEDTKDGNPYLFYKYDDGEHQEYNYVLRVGESNTGILLGNLISQEEARACFEALTFSLAE